MLSIEIATIGQPSRSAAYRRAAFMRTAMSSKISKQGLAVTTRV
jgi:hypothetical protein